MLSWSSKNSLGDSSVSIAFDSKCIRKSDLEIERDKKGEIEIIPDNKSIWVDNRGI